MIRVLFTGIVALGASVLVAPAAAVPISFTFAGYLLENIGNNTIGIAGGGSSSGVPRTVFVAGTSVGPSGGTTAAANLAGAPTSAPNFDAATNEWVRVSLNPGPAQLAPLTVLFSNGADTLSFSGRDLNGLSVMPLVINPAVDPSVDPRGPLVTWQLPGNAGDVDLVQLVFYNNETNREIGSRVVLPSTATQYDIVGPLSFGLDLVVNVRLIDLYDDSLPFTFDNIQRQSRTYINYLAPIPEPATWGLMALGLVALGTRGRLKRERSTSAAAA